MPCLYSCHIRKILPNRNYCIGHENNPYQSFNVAVIWSGPRDGISCDLPLAHILYIRIFWYGPLVGQSLQQRVGRWRCKLRKTQVRGYWEIKTFRRGSKIHGGDWAEAGLYMARYTKVWACLSGVFPLKVVYLVILQVSKKFRSSKSMWNIYRLKKYSIFTDLP